MTLRKSQRVRKPVTVWEEKSAPSPASDPKITRKTARNQPETALRPIATGPLPKSSKLDENHLPDLPTYEPPLKLRYKPSESSASGLSKLQTFKKLFSQVVVDIIVNATNSYAENARETTEKFSEIRPWKPVNSTDIWRYIGCLLYMGEHIEKKHEEYWGNSHRLNECLSLKRFQQIHRYLTLRDGSIHPQENGECFAWSVEPIASIIRRNCSANWTPSSHLAIDEAMIPYQGRSKHTVKLKNKPISEGYKVWVLEDSGYVYNWLWHSRESGPEGIPKGGLIVQQKVPQGPNSVHLAPTFALVIRLAEHLHEQHPNHVFCLFLDNLFLNINVSHALLALNICCTGTTRKNALGIPQWLIKLKEHNRGLVWNSTLAQIEGYTLCFLWQDNNAVLGMTTAFRLKDETVWSYRKRPAPTSTNAHIVRPVFGDLVRKWLRIPLAIDQYNHYMGGVDVADQLRKNMTVHRPWEARTWRPLWYYILDTCLVNSYLIYKGNSEDMSNRAHRGFRETLSLELRNTPYLEAEKTTNKRRYSNSLLMVNQEALFHNWIQFKSRSYCVWCKEHAEEWTPKRARPVLSELVNGEQSPKRERQSKSQWGCDSCNVSLCRRGRCWDNYHSCINII